MTAETAVASTDVKHRSQRAETVALLLRDPLAMIAGLVLLALIAAALFGTARRNSAGLDLSDPAAPPAPPSDAATAEYEALAERVMGGDGER